MSNSTRFWNRILLIGITVLAIGNHRAEAQVVINTGAPLAPLYAVGPIYLSSTMFYKYSRFAYLYTQDELAAAGIQPGAVIYQVGWMKSTSSSSAGPASFNIYMKNSLTSAYSDASADWSALSSGTSLQYANSAQSIPATANPDFINFTLSTPFTYTGESLEILTEWDISAAPEPIATGSFEWENTTVTDRIYGKGNSTMPTSLSSTTNNTSIDNKRPVIQFTLDGSSGIQAATVESMFAVYPNPAENFIKIRNLGGATMESIEVLDLLGKVVYSQGREAGSNPRVDVSAFGPGAYFLRATTSEGPVVRRFTVR